MQKKDFIRAMTVAGAACLLSSKVNAQRPVTAGFLFSYQILAPAQFDAAYKAHLEWHRQNDDRLTWYGWYVLAGPGTGMFIDGTFGSSFEAMDRRPKPADDGRHFAETAAHHSKPELNTVWALWPEVSTTFSLEEQKATPFLDVLYISVKPGSAKPFEARLAALAARRRPSEKGWTWYRGVTGQKQPGYLVMIPRNNWSGLEGRGNFLSELARQAFDLKNGNETGIDEMVADATSQVWRYRSDLSYYPSK